MSSVVYTWPGNDYLDVYTEHDGMIYQYSRVRLWIQPMQCPEIRGDDHVESQTNPIVVQVTSPSGVDSYPIAYQSTDDPTRYYADIYVTESGTWTYAVRGGSATLGNVRAARTGTVYVLPVDITANPAPTITVYYGAGVAGLDAVTTLTELETTTMDLTLDVTLDDEKLYFAYPSASATPVLSIGGVEHQALPATTITVETVSYELVESTDLMTGSVTLDVSES